MSPRNETSKKNEWSIEDSALLYGLDLWGKDYFSINELGNINVYPKGNKNESLDLKNLVKELKSRNIKTPLILRFDDILEDRLKKLHVSFETAIHQYEYSAKFKGVFPIKCNQQRHVLEEIVRCGKQWNFGLEAGSKAELLIALSLLDDPEALLICNGYKDQRYIETAILGRQIGRQPVVVIEQSDEVDRIIKASKVLGAAPLIGIRAKLSSESSGRWGNSIGANSKFGLSIPEILKAVKKLADANLINELILLHFHVGSQINDIAILKNALQEAGQIYIELSKLGAPMGYLDVGGGLGVDYDGSRTATLASTNYSLQNYANDVVATIQECCKAKNIKVPTLISESGRALSSHFSLLVFNILGVSSVPTDIPIQRADECLSVQNLRMTLTTISNINVQNQADISKLQEAWNDALKFKEDALAAFRLGYIDLLERAIAEQLTWACAKALSIQLPKNKLVPEELQELNTSLAEIYYSNLSVFRSAPDTWAIDQLFPIMPIHRLNEKPTQLGHFADLTCDSDGKLARFIDNGQVKPLLELHTLYPSEDYWIGMFLGGAYQEVMGNLHNLFGSTNSIHIRLSANGSYKLKHVIRGNTKAEVLNAMEHESEQLLERLRIASELAIQKGNLQIDDAQRFINHIEASLRQSTYLQE
ncbi:MULTISPECIES: biosynthetic arginine decarboxylase [Prochlorococcus]|uniref:biosynthetic arginine decarboxylase n=1 Tax=Prochlorococcus TaxID=1218 RepID=UPI000533779E|nr:MULTISPECIES: biosynthetic arginine decarboxylase [Prochlorococcus]KGG13342.1 Biosynthetic arginine decarboxylase [Prochlorococcus sp. MIT 0601]